MDIQYEHNSCPNRHSCYAYQIDKEDTEKNDGISLVGSISANDGSFGVEQPLQSNDLVIKNHHQDCRGVSTHRGYILFNDEQCYGCEQLFSDNI